MPWVTVWPTPKASHIADLRLIGIGELQGRKPLLGAFDAQNSQIAALIFEHDIGGEFALVGQRNLHFAGAFDDVIVGDDEAGRIDDDAGAERALNLLPWHHAKELPKE